MLELSLRKYAQEDLKILQRLVGDASMMEHLGGPETERQIQKRHERYLKSEGCYIIVEGPKKLPTGWIGYWEIEWRGKKTWETGWSVLPEYQGKGIATQATKMVLQEIRKELKYQKVHAFPNINNKPSNAICRKAGFTLLGKTEVEYPKGHQMNCNDWEYDLE